MLTNHTGFQHWFLNAAGGGDNPAMVQGATTTFNLNTVPLFQDRMANYIPACEVTITGILTQSGGTGVRQPFDALARVLVDSLEVKNAWYGAPVSPQHVKGAYIPLIEQILCGYRAPSRKRGFFPAANGAYSFSYTFLVPLSIGLGQKPHHSSQLAAFYKEAQLNVNVAAASVLTALSPGASLSSLAARCSAILVPEPELRLGPIVEFIDYQAAASTGQTGIPIQSFGNTTQTTKTEKGAGLVSFHLLTSNFGLPGAFLPENVTRLNVPWRGQNDTAHIVPYLTQQLLAMGNQRVIGSVTDQASANALSDMGSFPYVPGTDHSNSTNELTGLLGLPVVAPADQLETSKVQVVNGDEQINLTLSSGPSGTHHMLACHLRSWQQAAYVDAATYLSSLKLPDKVLKSGSGDLVFVPKTLKKNQSIAKRKLRFLPVVLKRQTPSTTDRVSLPSA